MWIQPHRVLKDRCGVEGYYGGSGEWLSELGEHGGQHPAPGSNGVFPLEDQVLERATGCGLDFDSGGDLRVFMADHMRVYLGIYETVVVRKLSHSRVRYLDSLLSCAKTARASSSLPFCSSQRGDSGVNLVPMIDPMHRTI